MKKVILITGGSRGIGRATAFKMSELGYAVCINYKENFIAADDVVEQIKESGGEAVAIAANIADEHQVIDMFREIDETLGPVRALVNNAAILESRMPVIEMDVSRLRRIFETNVIGTFLCSREAIRRMSTKYGGNGGAIVNISSISARYGSPMEFNDYAASKAAIDNLTIGLAREVANEGIRVNAVRPSLIITDMLVNAGNGDRFETVRKTHPLKRPGHAEEVASAIAWLLSEDASYTSGAIIDVNGGK